MSNTKTADDFINFLEQTSGMKLYAWQKEFAKAVFENRGEKLVLIHRLYGYSQILAYMELLKLIFLEVTKNENPH